MTDPIFRMVDGNSLPLPDDKAAEIRASWAAMTPPVPPPELTREAFCVALIGAGILTEAEAEDAALGAWPPKFEPALAGKDLVEKLTIKNTWRDIRIVPRNAPLFLDLLAYYAGAAGLSEVQAAALGDQIFAGAGNG